MLVSIVIRTLNEERHLPELLSCIKTQEKFDFELETVLVDSGSTDNTIGIAEEFGCRITHIKKSDFTFGRSLNIGCEFAGGEILVFVSGHCIPSSNLWLNNLINPIRKGIAGYTYGRQLGRDTTKFSEVQLFAKYFPQDSLIPQEGFFVNNANSALSRRIWDELRFDEEVTGLEDMELAKRMISNNISDTAYISEAPVYHIHDESWSQTKHRYEREAIALKMIMPEVQVSFWDALRYIAAGIFTDFMTAAKQRKIHKEFLSIIMFRTAQYIGTYKGNHEHLVLSREKRERYYYPTKKN